MSKIQIKRIYDAPSATDGYRVLVDRLWPRGVAKADADIHEWNKDIAPSTELRKWFDHRGERFDVFADAYKAELEKHTDELKRLRDISKKKTLTLLYGAKDPVINHARVLLDVLGSMK